MLGRLGEMLSGNLQPADPEPESTGGVANERIELFGISQIRQFRGESLQIDLSLHRALEVAPEQMPPGEGKLDIAEILDSRPRHDAKQEHDDARNPIAVREALKQRKN